MLCQGCIGYWCYVIDTQTKEEKVKNISVVYKFKDVFPEELPELPPQREIDFRIKFIPGANLSPKPHIIWPLLSLKN